MYVEAYSAEHGRRGSFTATTLDGAKRKATRKYKADLLIVFFSFDEDTEEHHIYLRRLRVGKDRYQWGHITGEGFEMARYGKTFGEDG